MGAGEQQITVEMAAGYALQLTTPAARQMMGQIRAQLGDDPAGTLDVLDEDHAMWEHHSGGPRTSRPQWSMDDLDEARVTWQGLAGKTRAFFEVVLSEPGRLFTSTEIVEQHPDVFGSARAVAGALNGFTQHADRAGRPLPFYWWAGETTRYAVRPSVAQVFLRARPH